MYIIKMEAEQRRIEAMPPGPAKDAALSAFLTQSFQQHQANGQGGRRRRGRKTRKGRKGRKRTMRRY